MWSSLYNLILGTATEEQKRMALQLLLILVLGSHIALACGFAPGIYAGFASRESVLRLEAKIENIQANQLLEAIDQEKRNVCRHVAEGNGAALNYSVKKRDELMREYNELTNQPVPPVTCEELGIRPPASERD